MQPASAVSTTERTRRPSRWGRAALALVLFAGLVAVLQGPELKRRALWWVVNACAAVDAVTGFAWPCLFTSTTPEGRRIVVLHAPLDKGHVLVVPLDPYDGLESPGLAGRVGSDYLEAAWRLRDVAAAQVGAKGDWADFGLAINGPWDRTQQQLHVHVECLKPTAVQQLAARRDIPVGPWVALDGRGTTLVRRWPHADLAGLDFRRDLYEALPLTPDRDLRRINLGAAGIVGLSGEREFLLLYATERSLERLLDPQCRVLNGGAQ